MRRLHGVVYFLLLCCLTSRAQTTVADIFGRTLNTRGITLVDWDGFMANPLLKFYIYAPTNAALPGSATLTANGARIYFDANSTVSSNGPTKTISLTSTSIGVPIRMSIFPDRDSASEEYTLTIVFTASNSIKQTNTVPIHVIDQDRQRTNAFMTTVNFDKDATGFFTNASRRALVQQAADDWCYFFTNMGTAKVSINAEQTFIWSNNFDGGYYVRNTNAYTGYQLYAYGTTNSTHRSGGEASYAGGVQTSNGVALKIKRSGGFEAEIYGNYNTRGWLFLTNESDWLATGNLGAETNDFYSIAHHEIGHALIFNEAHPGFNTARTNGAFTSAAVTNYFGGIVPIDTSDHLNGSIDPESGQGSFGYEYYGSIPRKRWVMTKLDLLCAQEVGYTLRDVSALAALTWTNTALTPAYVGIDYSNALSATGGIVVYVWDVVSGTLPPGMTLDSFSGALVGTPTSSGTFSFDVRVRDYHENQPGVTQTINFVVSPPPALQLSLFNNGAQPRILVAGTTGQHQTIEGSGNLSNWFTLTTNATGTNLFEFNDPDGWQSPTRFYRALVVP
ncbi:MAG: peptidase [Verrucomicrobiales bacterium]|nr:peptidase [Verrucomicrobiales bacterium]